MRFHPEVKEEVLATYFWYEEQAAGLGNDFIQELEISYRAIEEFPNTWPGFKFGFKRYLLTRFPYSI